MVNYDNLPETKKNDKYFWVGAIAQDYETVLREKDKLIPPEIRNDKYFWTVVIRKNPIAILDNYGLIPQELFTPEEHVAYWIYSSRNYPVAVLEHYHNAPDVVKTHPEFIRQLRSVPSLLGLFDNIFSPETYSGKSVLGDEITDLMTSVRTTAQNLRIDGTEGRTLGLEIELDNDHFRERHFGPTNDRTKLYLFVSKIKQLMKTIQRDGNLFDKSYYWNLHLNLGVTKEEIRRWSDSYHIKSDSYHINSVLEDLVHLLIFPSNTLMRNLYNLYRLRTRNLVLVKGDIMPTRGRPEVGRIEIKEGSISGLTDTLYLQWAWGMIDHTLRQDETYAAWLNAQFKEAYQRNGLLITRTLGTSQDKDKRALEELNQSGKGHSKMRRVRHDILGIILEELR